MNQYTFDEIKTGMKEEFFATITDEKMKAFCEITADTNPLHLEEAYAKKAGYAGIVVYGMLTASFLSTAAGVYLPGQRSLLHSIEEIKFLKPCYSNQTVRVVVQVQEKSEAYSCIRLKVTMYSQAEEKILQAKMNVLVRGDLHG